MGWPSIDAVDRTARATKNAATGIRVSQMGVELQLVATNPDYAPLYPNVDVYVQIPAVAAQAAGFVGAVVRLYSVSEGTLTLQATGAIFAPVAGQGVKAVSVRSRGGIDRWISTIQLDGALAIPTVPIEATIVTFDGSGDSVGLGSNGARTIPATTVAAATGVLSATPARLFKFFGAANDAMPGPPRWLQIFDKATVPVLGDVPRLPGIPVGAGPTAFALTLDPNGLSFALGISWGVSTTIDTFTAPGAGVNTVKVAGEMG
jgi:hypothetical protein